MTQRNRKRLLLAVNALLALGIVAMAASVLVPLDEPPDVGVPPHVRSPASAQPEPAVQPIGAYAVIFRRDLLAPIFDADTAKGGPAAAQPMPAIRLLGTAVEPGFSYAMFRNAVGETKLVRVGESVEGAEVVTVDARSATLKYMGRIVTVPVERETPGSPQWRPGLPVTRTLPVPRVAPPEAAPPAAPSDAPPVTPSTAPPAVAPAAPPPASPPGEAKTEEAKE